MNLFYIYLYITVFVFMFLTSYVFSIEPITKEDEEFLSNDKSVLFISLALCSFGWVITVPVMVKNNMSWSSIEVKVYFNWSNYFK